MTPDIATHPEMTARKPHRLTTRPKQVYTEEQKSAALELLREDPRKSLEEIAQIVGLSFNRIWKWSQTVEQGIVSDEKTLVDLARRIKRHLPAEDRVKRLKAVVNGDVDAKKAFSVLQGLKYADELVGIVTKKAQKEAEAQEKAPGPMFVLPPGSAVIVAPVDINPRKQLDNAGNEDVIEVSAQVVEPND